MPLSVVIPPTQESQPQSRQARKAGSRAILVATMTGMLGILGATFVVVHHRRPMYTDMPSRFLSSRVAAQRSTSAEPFVSLESDRHAPIAAAAAVKSLRASTAAEDTTSFTSSKSTAPYTKAALADEIIDLPGLSQKSLNFRQFSGYLNLKGTEKNIFYWYVEAEEKPDEAPLVFWTNGGPGCSGLFGFMNENGPFRPTVDGRAVHLNPYSWNKIANMLFVEQPVTVGFSYTDNPKDLVFGDKQAAEDNFQVIQAFLERYPHMRGRDFHLSGESYGGHYLPQLAKYIVDHPNKDAPINLKGFLVGNPLTDPVENLVGAIDSFWGHSILPPNLYDEWLNKCRIQTQSPGTLFGDTCMRLQSLLWNNVRGLNPYALDYPVCLTATKTGLASARQRGAIFPPSTEAILAQGRNQRYKLLSHTLPAFIGNRSGLDQASMNKEGTVPRYEPCQDAFAASYLNRKDVQHAIHARAGTKWADCSDTVFYNFNRNDRHAFMQDTYTYLVDDKKNLKLRILIFSGADDSVCATQGTLFWVGNMGWPIKQSQEWTSWGIDGQVAGFLQGYQNGITIATVSGAGHEVRRIGVVMRNALPGKHLVLTLLFFIRNRCPLTSLWKPWLCSRPTSTTISGRQETSRSNNWFKRKGRAPADLRLVLHRPHEWF